MAKRYDEINQELMQFIWQQQMFFVATAPADGHVNLSPKGLDSLRVIDANTVIWLNITGSGNETAAHVLENGRMTIMFCAFEGRPMILRLYGESRVVHPRDAEWGGLLAHFDTLADAGARQIFVLKVSMVQTSCGMGVPLMDYRGQRTQLVEWAEKKGPEGIADYWDKKNRVSLDGRPTQIFGEEELAG